MATASRHPREREGGENDKAADSVGASAVEPREEGRKRQQHRTAGHDQIVLTTISPVAVSKQEFTDTMRSYLTTVDSPVVAS